MDLRGFIKWYIQLWAESLGEGFLKLGLNPLLGVNVGLKDSNNSFSYQV